MLYSGGMFERRAPGINGTETGRAPGLDLGKADGGWSQYHDDNIGPDADRRLHQQPDQVEQRMGELFGRPLGGDRPQPTEASMAAAEQWLDTALKNDTALKEILAGPNQALLLGAPERYGDLSKAIADPQNNLRIEVAASLYNKLAVMKEQHTEAFSEQAFYTSAEVIDDPLYDPFDLQYVEDQNTYRVGLMLDMLSGQDWGRVLGEVDPQDLDDRQLEAEYPELHDALLVLGAARWTRPDGTTVTSLPASTPAELLRERAV